jgi:hypothetical protein
LKTQIKTGDYNFLSPIWEDISEEGRFVLYFRNDSISSKPVFIAIDLIKSLMNTDPIDRIDIPEALVSSFFF